MKQLISFLIVVSLNVSYVSGGKDPISDATNQPQVPPFAQNWSNTGLITTNNDWSGVPGIIGYRGDELTAATGVDPRTILVDGSATPVSVIANQTNPDTFTTGGVIEFEIANPTIALNGSGTADVPHIVIHLNTTGFSNVQFACVVRDIDGSSDNAVQQVDVQYRVGGTGNYTSVPGGYIPDATTGPNEATLVTPLNLTLPAAANNQALVEVRVLTTNAVGNDEAIGIDDISVTATGGPKKPGTAVVDFNGDGRSDYAVVRNVGGGPGGQIRWWINYSGTDESVAADWGISGDRFVPVDFDGDGKADIAVWRPITSGQPSGNAYFYIFQSSNGTVRIEDFGQVGDDPSVVGDYDGDGKADVAVYRSGASPGQQSFWFYRGSSNNPGGNVTFVQWGQNGDFPAPGDYDGDGMSDFVIQRNDGGGRARFWLLQTAGGADSVIFGTPNDLIIPGDYDGDGKTDIAVARASGGQIFWFVRPSSTGTISAAPYAIFGSSAIDVPAPGDYDGDGKTDIAIWRPSGTEGESRFWIALAAGGVDVVTFGQGVDYPVANYNTH
jgi:hypothetical protein